MSERGVNMIAITLAVAAILVTVVARLEGGALAPAPLAAPVAVAPTRAVEAARPLDAPNVVRDPADVPPPITRSSPTTVRITLTIRELVAELADGTTYTFWTFDETVPGPMLRVMLGDTVEMTLVNPESSSMGHNIDLHAVNGPGGGAAVTNVQPGESKTFSFKPLNTGLFIYHCAFPPPWMHIAQGMYGGILVEPPGGLPPVDREFYVIQGEWYTSEPFGTKGHMLFDNTKAFAELPEYYTFKFSRSLVEKSQQRGLPPVALQQLLYFVAIAVKDYEVVRLLVNHGYVDCQAALAFHQLEASDEDRLAWRLARLNPVVRLICLASQLKLLLSIRPLVEKPAIAPALIQQAGAMLSFLPLEEQGKLWTLTQQIATALGDDTHQNIATALQLTLEVGG